MPLKTCFLLAFCAVKHPRNNPQREKRNTLAGEKNRKIDIQNKIFELFSIFVNFDEFGTILGGELNFRAAIKKLYYR